MILDLRWRPVPFTLQHQHSDNSSLCPSAAPPSSASSGPSPSCSASCSSPPLLLLYWDVSQLIKLTSSPRLPSFSSSVIVNLSSDPTYFCVYMDSKDSKNIVIIVVKVSQAGNAFGNIYFRSNHNNTITCFVPLPTDVTLTGHTVHSRNVLLSSLWAKTNLIQTMFSLL